MFERFSDGARQVLVLAMDESRLLKHDYIGTEHLLLGLLREEEGLAARVLESFDVSVDEVRAQVVAVVGEGVYESNPGQIPFTSRGKKALELSLREAVALGHRYIGTEHILLGLVRDGGGVAARILVQMGCDGERIRSGVLSVLADRPAARYPELEEEIEKVRADKEAAIEAQDFAKAAGLRDQERKLAKKQAELESAD